MSWALFRNDSPAGRPTTTMKRADLSPRREREVPPEIVRMQKLQQNPDAHAKALGVLLSWISGRSRSFGITYEHPTWSVELLDFGYAPAPSLEASATDEDLLRAVNEAVATFNVAAHDRKAAESTMRDEPLVSVGPGGDYRKDLSAAQCHL